MSNDVQKYDKQVYLRVSEAQRCRVHSSLMVPLFEAAGARDRPLGVFELVQSDRDVAFPSLMQSLTECLEVRCCPAARQGVLPARVDSANCERRCPPPWQAPIVALRRLPNAWRRRMCVQAVSLSTVPVSSKAGIRQWPMHLDLTAARSAPGGGGGGGGGPLPLPAAPAGGAAAAAQQQQEGGERARGARREGHEEEEGEEQGGAGAMELASEPNLETKAAAAAAGARQERRGSAHVDALLCVCNNRRGPVVVDKSAGHGCMLRVPRRRRRRPAPPAAAQRQRRRHGPGRHLHQHPRHRRQRPALHVALRRQRRRT